MKKYKRWVHAFLLLTLILLSSFAQVSGAEQAAKKKTEEAKPKDISQAVTQSFNSEGNVELGMVVKLKDKDSGAVEPLPQSRSDKMLGVIVPADASVVTIGPQDIKKQQVFVATSGRYQVLISNQNGPIKTGDYIVMSSIDGVTMKADNEQPVTLGKAASNFNGTANVLSTVKLKDSAGKEVSVTVGRIPADLVISNNPLKQKSYDYLPEFMVNIAQTVANKSVSAARIYLSLVVLLISGVVTGMLIYGGVRSGMMAVGRNPLSKKSIMKSLVQTVIAGMIIFTAGVFAVYLLLKL